MNKTERPVSSIKHDDKRAAIPDSAHQGEEKEDEVFYVKVVG